MGSPREQKIQCSAVVLKNYLEVSGKRFGAVQIVEQIFKNSDGTNEEKSWNSPRKSA